MTEVEPKVSVEVLDGLKTRLDIEVAAETVSANIERAFHDLGHRVRIRGFRQGKVPRAVLERLYGQQVRNDVVERLVHQAYAAAIAAHKVPAVANPEIVVEPLGDPAVLRFSATVEVCPEVSVGDYENIEVERPTVKVEDDDVERVLARLVDGATRVHPVTDRTTVQRGDIVTLNIGAAIDGRAVPELTRRDVRVEAGAASFPGALEAQLEGLACGAPADIDVQYPSDFENSMLAGKHVSFTVAITGLGRKEVPALDDEFARSQGDYPDLAALRGAIRERLRQDGEQRAEAAVRDGVLGVLIERHPFDAPDAMVERRCDAMLESLSIQLPPGADRQKAFGTLRQELRPRAVRDVKAAILLDALAAKQALSVSDEDLAARIDRIADSANESRDRVRSLYRTEDRREALRAQMLRDSALSLLVERSRIRPAAEP
jgi:trigger factor